MKSPNKDNSVWLDIASMEYPRLLYSEEAEGYNGGFYENKNDWAFKCVHGRNLETRCVACEGLSILCGTRR